VSFSPPAAILAMVSLLVIMFVKSKFVFDSGEWTTGVVLVSIAAALLTPVLAPFRLPNRSSMVALAVVAIVAYLICFNRLYSSS
jgi:hypothetical protein